MLRTYDLTPEYYSKASRDFQLLGHIFDAVFNKVKTGIDMMDDNLMSRNSDRKLVDLVATTLGFESKHEYDVKDIYALYTSFHSLLRYKGTARAIEEATKILLKAQNIASTVTLNFHTDTKVLDIYTPSFLNDIILLEDILEYILPAGWNYNIYRNNVTLNIRDLDITVNDVVRVVQAYSPDTSDIMSDIGQTLVNPDILKKEQGRNKIKCAEPLKLGDTIDAVMKKPSETSTLMADTDLTTVSEEALENKHEEE